jgi:two-component system sensor histidine kinase ChvG
VSVRRAASRISVRLLAFNALLVFLPAAGVLFLDTYEQQLLRDQERAMVHQGRLLAAALSGREPLRSADARRTLVALEREADARIRVLDPGGRVLVDTSRLGPRQAADSDAATEAGPREHWLYRAGAAPFRAWRRWFAPPEPPHGSAERYAEGGPLRGVEIREALAGRYGAATRVSSGGQRSVTLYSALPIRRGSTVTGVVLVSQSTYRILQKLYQVRMDVLRVFLASLAVAIVLSLLVATTIARPIRRLRDQADALVDARGRLRGPLLAGDRRDEIGDLGRALERLTRRLEEHIGGVESFASDVSHELKNPLASIRAASELLADAEEPAERKRFLEMIQREVTRTERLLSGVREVTRLDAGAWPDAPEPVELGALLDGLASAFRTRGDDRVVVERPAGPLVVQASGEGLGRAFENVIDNALGLSPADEPVRVELAREGREARVQVLDRGPGLPPEHCARVFDRFFSYRPSDGAGGARRDRHAGLGLAIARAQVENAGGRITIANRPDGGACVEVRLPLGDAGGRVSPAARERGPA